MTTGAPGRLLTVVGARPQFVKAMPVSRAIARTPGLVEVMVHTGQHHDSALSDSFFRELDLPEPIENLGIHGGTHGEMTGRMLAALDGAIARHAPGLVIVYGDTNSTLAGALAAAKAGVPVAHVEAGLRVFDRTMPEETNRVVVDHVSRLLFAPTRAAVGHLKREGLVEGVHHVGDVMQDAVLAMAALSDRGESVLRRLGLTSGAYAVATLHRAATTDSAASLAAAVGYLRQQAARLPVVLPLHPRTREAANRFGVDLAGLRIIEPLGPIDMQRLLAGCALVLTDSGGLQKEAYFHRKPCVTLRDDTEWSETVEAGWNRLWTVSDYRPRREIDDYGAGDAAERIVATIARFVAETHDTPRATTGTRP
ncbi:non-hydrolyzing UDP-N-acetylglucosamine 2-epimerase [Caulobacter sp. BE254]|uniref:non-hydrolyzing UDP-N-acetylglucosamine 2-epimerase n=1 Tax=Caulobacter sp. BE254 TaxID=2817720 RepID=UPI002866F82B|nr:UDP-N-acetylglucosamine 2-epimerase (non-hydrolyzing) [Caulobacter sp. BE254]MDR7118732.1 UDP-GlcNAc3NAcA epimerase [Caulobacter sp. BE254]